MRALGGDVTFEARQIAQHGLATMFGGLSPIVRLVDDVVEVQLRSNLDFSRPTTGGLTLVQSLWTVNASTPISAAEPPMIIYAARGTATLWESQELPAPHCPGEAVRRVPGGPARKPRGPRLVN